MWVRQGLVFAYGVVGVGYLVWRVCFTLNAARPVYSSLFLLAETYFFATALVFYWLVSGRCKRAQPALPRPALSIDVLIATYNEDVELVRATALAAQKMRLPHRTVVCDDGCRPEIEAMAREIGVDYITRDQNVDYKAGNLNHALTQTDGELVLVLDADHVARRQMLERLVSHFSDPRVALVQTPQVFYNIDSFQHGVSMSRQSLWHEATVFHHRIQPGADRYNAAFFVGTGAMLRRRALEAIGGFATGTITEDIHTSLRLHASGFRSVYVDEVLGFLMAPETPLAYARQRLRWAQGAMQILRTENPLTKRALTPWQRICYLSSLTTYLGAYPHGLLFLAPALFLLFGLSPIAFESSYALPVFAAYIGLNLLMYKVFSAPHGRVFLSECFRLLNIGIFLWASIRLLRPQGLTFLVTPKGRHRGVPLSLWLLPVPLTLLNVVAVAFGVAAWVGTGGGFAPSLLALTFAAFFSVVGLWTLGRTWQHRAAAECFGFPVRVYAPARLVDRDETVLLRIRRLQDRAAYAECSGALSPGDRLELDLTAIGLRTAVRGVIVGGVAKERLRLARSLHKVAFEALGAADREALERYVFNIAVPDVFFAVLDAPPGPPPDLDMSPLAVSSGGPPSASPLNGSVLGRSHSTRGDAFSSNSATRVASPSCAVMRPIRTRANRAPAAALTRPLNGSNGARAHRAARRAGFRPHGGVWGSDRGPPRSDVEGSPAESVDNRLHASGPTAASRLPRDVEAILRYYLRSG